MQFILLRTMLNFDLELLEFFVFKNTFNFHFIYFELKNILLFFLILINLNFVNILIPNTQ